MPKLAKILEKCYEGGIYVNRSLFSGHSLYKTSIHTLYDKQIESMFAMRRFGIVQTWCECYTLWSVVAEEEKKRQRRKVAFDGIETFFWRNCTQARYRRKEEAEAKSSLSDLRWLERAFQGQYLPQHGTTAVLGKVENLLWSGLQWPWSCHSNELTPLPILPVLAVVFLGTGNSPLVHEVFSSPITVPMLVKFKRNL